MPGPSNPEAIVIGSGPNGLAAAITIARAGHAVVVYEAEDSIGGSTRSAQLTEPGFLHDVCSCVHPMAASSPLFRELNLKQFGLRWIYPEIPAAHPLSGDRVGVVGGNIASNLPRFGPDRQKIDQLLGGLAGAWQDLSADILGPLQIPKHPLAMARFGWNAIQPATRIAARFKTREARAVFAGMAAHSMLPLNSWMTGAIGIMLWSTCYAVGWPFAAGGSQCIANALAGVLQKLGGQIVTGRRVSSLDEFSGARAILCDVTPRQLVALAGSRLSSEMRRKYTNFRYGPGSFKVDWALNSPIPWSASECRRAGTVHVGGTFEEIAASEAAVWRGEHPDRPFVLLAQPSLFDTSRAPAGKHTAWAYCHVPNGSLVDMRERIESQIERFAPGFRDCILAASARNTAALESHNANLIGGDVGAGSMELGQFFTRPTRRVYSTGIDNVFLCSASTPPGPGVHGMCGYFAAQRALRKCF